MMRLFNIAVGTLALVLLIGADWATPVHEQPNQEPALDPPKPKPQTQADMRGRVTRISAEKNELVLKDNQGKDWNFLVPKECKVFINGRQATLSDLNGDDEAVVTYQMRGLVPMVATEIRCMRP